MFNRILVCVDPYPPGDTLLSCVIPLKECGAKEVVLAYILETDTHGLDSMLLAQARPEMERQQKLLEEAGFQVTMTIPKGKPAQALHDLAKIHDVSVIVIGTHSQGASRNYRLGQRFRQAPEYHPPSSAAQSRHVAGEGSGFYLPKSVRSYPFPYRFFRHRRSCLRPS